MNGEVARMIKSDRGTGTLVSDGLGGEPTPIGLLALPDPSNNFPNVETRFRNRTVRSRSVADVDTELVEGFLVTVNTWQNETRAVSVVLWVEY